MRSDNCARACMALPSGPPFPFLPQQQTTQIKRQRAPQCCAVLAWLTCLSNNRLLCALSKSTRCTHNIEGPAFAMMRCGKKGGCACVSTLDTVRALADMARWGAAAASTLVRHTVRANIEAARTRRRDSPAANKRRPWDSDGIMNVLKQVWRGSEHQRGCNGGERGQRALEVELVKDWVLLGVQTGFPGGLTL